MSVSPELVIATGALVTAIGGVARNILRDRAKLLTDDASNAKAEAMMATQEAKTRAIKESAAPKVTTKKARK